MPCPSIEDLDRFVNGKLSDTDRENFEWHVATCASCRSQIANMAKDLDLADEIRAVKTAELDGSATVTQEAASGGGGELRFPERLGPVELIREIGRGGMGVVWLGRHGLLGRDVAVKFLTRAKPGTDDPSYAKLLDGARAAASVRHSNLTLVYNADLFERVPYLVLDYVDGSDLSQIGAAGVGFEQSVCLALMDLASAGVAELHKHNIVHRDIKPSNVMLDVNGHVFVTDFGLACPRPFGEIGSVSETVAGTPPYMAPEMFGGAVSARSDVYALGIMMFQLLTGKRPFRGNLDEIRSGHLNAPLPIHQLTEQGVDAALIEVIERATNKQAMYRHKTADHFRQALNEAARDAGMVPAGPAELQSLAMRQRTSVDRSQPTPGDKTPSSSYYEAISESAAVKRKERKSTPAESPEPIERPLMMNENEVFLQADVPCASCDYNLRGLPSGRNACPECGAPTSESLARDRLMFADPIWIGRSYLGLKFVVAGTLIVPIGLLFFYSLRSDGAGFDTFLGMIALAAASCCAVGISLTMARADLPARAPALAVLACAAATAVTMICYMASGNTVPDMLSDVFGAATLTAFAVSFASFLRYLAKLLGRIPAPALARSSKRHTWCIVAMFACGAVMVGLNKGGVTLANRWPCAFIVAFLIESVLIIGLLETCRRRFATVLKSAFEHKDLYLLSARPEPREAGTLQADVPCAGCDYNLRGLPKACDACPECGKALDESLYRERLMFANRALLQRIRKGLIVTEVGLISLPIWLISVMLLAGREPWLPLMFGGPCLVSTVIAIGILVARPAGGRAYLIVASTTLTLTLFNCVATAALLWAITAESLAEAWIGPTFNWSFILTVIAIIVAMTMFLRGLRALLLRVPDARGAKRAAQCAWQLPVFSALFVAASAILRNAPSLLEAEGAIRVLRALGPIISGLLLLGVLAGILGVVRLGRRAVVATIGRRIDHEGLYLERTDDDVIQAHPNSK